MQTLTATMEQTKNQMTSATKKNKKRKSHNQHQELVMRSKQAEANARREVNRRWQELESTPRYRKAAAAEACQTATKRVKEEVLDGILLSLNEKHQAKSASVQNRMLRRIVEKRQAQASCKANGRTDDLVLKRICMTNTSRCLKSIHKKRSAA